MRPSIWPKPPMYLWLHVKRREDGMVQWRTTLRDEPSSVARVINTLIYYRNSATLSAAAQSGRDAPPLLPSACRAHAVCRLHCSWLPIGSGVTEAVQRTAQVRFCRMGCAEATGDAILQPRHPPVCPMGPFLGQGHALCCPKEQPGEIRFPLIQLLLNPLAERHIVNIAKNEAGLNDLAELLERLPEGMLLGVRIQSLEEL